MSVTSVEVRSVIYTQKKQQKCHFKSLNFSRRKYILTLALLWVKELQKRKHKIRFNVFLCRHITFHCIPLWLPGNGITPPYTQNEGINMRVARDTSLAMGI